MIHIYYVILSYIEMFRMLLKTDDIGRVKRLSLIMPSVERSLYEFELSKFLLSFTYVYTALLLLLSIYSTLKYLVKIN